VQHFFFGKKSIGAPWKWPLRTAVLSLVLVALILTRGFWSIRIGRSLVCTEQLTESDLILVENLDRNYLLFERAAILQKQGFASRVLVPVQVSYESQKANAVSVETAELMARVAQMRAPQILPIRVIEPISLNAAYAIRDFLIGEHVRTLIVVVAGFRSMRSSLIYQAVMTPAHIRVSCVPVFTGATLQNWSKTWHGIQEVTEQVLKLQFYRFYVLLKPLRTATL
jgi:hypothetical protein